MPAVIIPIIATTLLTGAMGVATPFLVKLFEGDDDGADEMINKLTEDEKEIILYNKRKTDQVDWINAMKDDELNSLMAFRRADDTLIKYQTSENPYIEPNKPNGTVNPVLVVNIGLITTYLIVKRFY